MHPIDIDSVVCDLKFVELSGSIPPAGTEDSKDKLVDRFAVFYIPADYHETVRYLLTRTKQEFDTLHNRTDFRNMGRPDVAVVGAITVTIRALDDKDNITFNTYTPSVFGIARRVEATKKIIENLLMQAHEKDLVVMRKHNAEVDSMFDRMRRGEEIIPGVPITDVLVL